MSPELLEELKAWLAWAENGAPEAKPYSRQYGLCQNLERGGDLRVLFGYKSYPFGNANYVKRMNKRTQHLCPRRLAWVRDQIERN